MVCLSPNEIVADPEGVTKRFRDLILQLHSLNRLSNLQSDAAVQEFEHLIETSLPVQREKFEKFSYKTDRLDSFFVDILRGGEEDYNNLWLIIKMVCVMFHGNADVERGFSVSIYA